MYDPPKVSKDLGDNSYTLMFALLKIGRTFGSLYVPLPPILYFIDQTSAITDESNMDVVNEIDVALELFKGSVYFLHNFRYMIAIQGLQLQ